jgi:hypothetical protein
MIPWNNICRSKVRGAVLDSGVNPGARRERNDAVRLDRPTRPRSRLGDAARGRNAAGRRRRARRFPRSVEAARAGLALHNLRGIAIAFIVMMHSFLAYLPSVDSNGYAFGQPPYRWVAFPILDRSRWAGFDAFCASQDVYLTSLMFFLSGVFTSPSLERNGVRRFLTRRILKLGGALLFGVAVVMPVALYPVYRQSAADPSLAGYVRAYQALPFMPSGPMWFLSVLMALTVVVAALGRWAPRAIAAADSLAASFENRSILPFAAFAIVTVAAYAALAMAFTPWRWSAVGPFAIQLCRPLLYAAYFLLGFVAGRQGLGRGILNADGFLAKRRRTLLGLAPAALVVWMGLAGLALELGDHTPVALQFLANASYAVAGLFGVLLALTAAFRFGGARRPLVGAVADKALPLYLLHYAPVVWMQYGLLDLGLPAVVKGPIVFVGTLAISGGLATGAEFVGIGRIASLGGHSVRAHGR